MVFLDSGGDLVQAGAIGLFITLRDTPRSVGLPDCPEPKSKKRNRVKRAPRRNTCCAGWYLPIH